MIGEMWSASRFCDTVAEICVFALENAQDRQNAMSVHVTKFLDADISKFLQSASYVISCIAAQHTPRGKEGVTENAVYEALEMGKQMGYHERYHLSHELWKKLQE